MSVSCRPSSKCRPFAGGVRTFRRSRPTSCAKLVTDPPKGFSRSALTLLSALPWHGNARELQQLVPHARAVGPTARHSARRPPGPGQSRGLAARVDPGLTLREAKARFERDCISARHEDTMAGSERRRSSQYPTDKSLPKSETTERFALAAFYAQMRSCIKMILLGHFLNTSPGRLI